MSVFIIAEAGVNHNGSLEIAEKLIDAAKQAGADAVKFQTFKADNLVSKKAEKAAYQKQTTDSSELQHAMIKKLELDEEAHRRLIAYCQKQDILFLSTPFDHESIDLLDRLGMEIFKIPSGEITNLPYLRHIGSLQKQVILSTGMSNLTEINDALHILTTAGTPKDNIVVLHATTEYPCPMDEVNLNSMKTIISTFGVKVGYSDHTNGIEIPIAAVAMGAAIIEKHFTLDKNMEGPDHQASLEPPELISMVKAIRNIEKALGDGVKKASPSELKNLSVVRKSIVASQPIRKGEYLTAANITVKRPGTGISPMRYDELLGTLAQKDYETDECI